MSEVKKPYVAVTRPKTNGDQSCFYPLKHFSAADEFDGSEEGDSVVLTLKMMTDQEYENLGD